MCSFKPAVRAQAEIMKQMMAWFEAELKESVCIYIYMKMSLYVIVFLPW